MCPYYTLDEFMVEKITNKDKAKKYIKEFGNCKPMRSIYHMIKKYKYTDEKVYMRVEAISHLDCRTAAVGIVAFKLCIEHGKEIPEYACEVSIKNLYSIYLAYMNNNTYRYSISVDDDEELEFDPYIVMSLYYLFMVQDAIMIPFKELIDKMKRHKVELMDLLERQLMYCTTHIDCLIHKFWDLE